MSLNILGGTYKGLTLQVPSGDLIRPTSVMLRRKIFDSHQDMSGCTFIDLCAGSGAMGLESLSRGAESVILVEKNPKVFKYTMENSLRFANQSIQTVNKKALEWLAHFKQTYQSYDSQRQAETVLFLDPPYEDHQVYLDILRLLEEETWFCGELWLESDEQKGISEKKLPLTRGKLLKTYVQGSNYVAIINYQK